MNLSRSKPAVSAAASVETVKEKKKKKLPKVEDFLDYERGKGADYNDLWIAYASFHGGDYERARTECENLSKDPNCHSDVWCNLACCYFMQAHMTRLRDLENTYHETVSEKAQMILEKFIKNQLDIELPDELRVLMVDKDTLVGALNAAHDCHLLAIDNKEDSIVSRAKKDRDSLIETIQNSELKRNRQKIVEIEQYIEQQKGEEDEIDQQN